MNHRTLPFSSALIGAAIAALFSAASPSLHAEHYVIGLSPRLSMPQRDVVWRQVSDFALKDLKPSDALDIYDALGMQRISRVSLPQDPALSENVRARLRQIGKDLGLLQQFLKSNPAGGGDLGASADIDEPKFLDLAGRQLRASGEPLRVLIAGAPTYRDPRQPAFDFTGGYYPADGHLVADPAVYPFSVRDRKNALDGVSVYHLCYGGDSESVAAAKGVARFWTLFVGLQGGVLAAYAEDPAIVFGRFREGVREPFAKAEIDPAQTKPEMVRRVTIPERREEREELARGEQWITSKNVPPAPALSRPIVQVLRVGARWKQPVDIDVYSCTRGNPELFYGHNRSAEGIHVKDFLTAPPAGTNSFEMIEYHKPVDIRQVSAWLNFYGGRVSGNGVEVEVRVWADDKIYCRTLRIPASSGNQGGNGGGRASDPHWVMIDVQSIAGLH